MSDAFPTDPPAPDADHDPLDELRDRIQATVQAAQRLHAEAQDARAQQEQDGTAPNGWSTPEDRQERAEEVHALARLIGVLRELMPDELQDQLRDLLRQLLLLARAILDWCLERLGLGEPPAPADGPPTS